MTTVHDRVDIWRSGCNEDSIWFLLCWGTQTDEEHGSVTWWVTSGNHYDLLRSTPFPKHLWPEVQNVLTLLS